MLSKIVQVGAGLMGVVMRAGAWWLSLMATLPSTVGDLSKITSCSWTKDAMARCETEYLTMSDQDNEDDCNLQLFENSANILGRAMYWNSNSDACIVCEGTAKDWTVYTRHRVHVCEITGCSSGYEPASDGTDCLPVPTPQPTHFSYSTLMLHVDFDGGAAADDSGNGYDGTVSGGAATPSKSTCSISVE